MLYDETQFVLQKLTILFLFLFFFNFGIFTFCTSAAQASLDDSNSEGNTSRGESTGTQERSPIQRLVVSGVNKVHVLSYDSMWPELLPFLDVIPVL